MSQGFEYPPPSYRYTLGERAAAKVADARADPPGGRRGAGGGDAAGWPGDAEPTVSSTVTRNGNRLDLADLHANQFPVVPPIVVDADRDHLLLVVGGRHGARLALLSG